MREGGISWKWCSERVVGGWLQGDQPLGPQQFFPFHPANERTCCVLTREPSPLACRAVCGILDAFHFIEPGAEEAEEIALGGAEVAAAVATAAAAAAGEAGSAEPTNAEMGEDDGATPEGEEQIEAEAEAEEEGEEEEGLEEGIADMAVEESEAVPKEEVYRLLLK